MLDRDGRQLVEFIRLPVLEDDHQVRGQMLIAYYAGWPTTRGIMQSQGPRDHLAARAGLSASMIMAADLLQGLERPISGEWEFAPGRLQPPAFTLLMEV